MSNRKRSLSPVSSGPLSKKFRLYVIEEDSEVEQLTDRLRMHNLGPGASSRNEANGTFGSVSSSGVHAANTNSGGNGRLQPPEIDYEAISNEMNETQSPATYFILSAVNQIVEVLRAMLRRHISTRSRFSPPPTKSLVTAPLHQETNISHCLESESKKESDSKGEMPSSDGGQ